MDTALPPTLSHAGSSDTMVSGLDKALSVLTTTALVLGLSVAMLALMATPGQPLDILLHAGGCPVAV